MSGFPRPPATAPIGPAGGGLAGNYPNPQVVTASDGFAVTTKSGGAIADTLEIIDATSAAALALKIDAAGKLGIYNKALSFELITVDPAGPTDVLNGLNAEWLSPQGFPGAVQATRYIGGTASGAPIAGAHVVGDMVVDQTGAIWICTAAGTPGIWTEVGSGAPSGIIGLTEYAPASVNYTLPNGNLAAVDITNLTVTFEAPATGAVVVTISCPLQLQANNTGNPAVYFGLLNATGGAFMGLQVNVINDIVNVITGVVDYSVCVPIHVAGLVPGDSYTFQFAAATNADGAVIQLRDNASVTRANGGSCLLTVTAAPN